MADDVFGIVGTTQAGNFHVEEVVAEGGFGVVYRAMHGGFRAPVALKCLKVSEARTARERDLFLEKFREEAQLLFRLSASIPEVVRPLHVDVLHLRNGQFVPFLALEWLEGESLDKVIDRRRMQGEPPMPLQKLVKMMRPIAAAIAKAHRFPSPNGTVSIIHRDLKPENIFITNQDGEDRLKILDFGIAQARSVAEQAVGRVTQSDKLNAFSPAYAAPEQWVPKRFGQAGPWTDVWGLAITMVEAIVGRQVIEGETQGMMGTALDPTRRPTPRAEGANVPAEVDAVFERALAVNPRDRTKDIETFWSELEAAMGLQPSLGARAHDDPHAPSSVPPASTGRPASVKPRPVGQVWLETPKETAGLELDLDAAPASIRSPLARRDGPLSVRPPPAPSAPPPPDSGLEMELPAPPPSVRPRPGSMGGAGAQAQGPASYRPQGGPPGSVPPVLAPGGLAAQPPPSDRSRAAPAAAAAAAAAAARVSSPELGWNASGPQSGTSSGTPMSSRMIDPGKGGALEADLGAPRMARSPSQRPAPPPALAARPPGPAAPAAARPPMRPAPAPMTEEPAGQTLGRRLAVPVLLIFVACAIMVTDLVMRRSGAGLTFGPLRWFWVAGPCLLVGLGLFFWKLLGEQSDG